MGDRTRFNSAPDEFTMATSSGRPRDLPTGGWSQSVYIQKERGDKSSMNRFKMVILPPEFQEEWPEKIREAVPEASVKLFRNPADAISEIADADCAFGDVVPELFANNKRLRWIQCYAAGPRASFWHEQLV